MTYRLIHGDSIEVMRNAKAESVHAIVCDPPYGIDFMGKSWDKPGEMVGTSLGLSGGFQKFPEGVKRPEMKRSDPHLFQAWCEAWATEAMRVLKPGGHLLAFGGTRMYHRLAAGIEDAGFEIRDTIMWMYGSGFPKSHNVGVNIDKMLGKQRERVAMSGGIPPGSNNYLRDHSDGPEAETKNGRHPVTDEARTWNGWGTALKPAVEPIVVARKPLAIPGKRPGSSKKATVAQNVLAHGTGAYNIDGCRIEGASTVRKNTAEMGYHGGNLAESYETGSDLGRWPANVIMDEDAGALLDRQTGMLAAGNRPRKRSADGAGVERGAYGAFAGQEGLKSVRMNSGGASRFFYCPKASRTERDAGLTDLDPAFAPTMGDGIGGREHNPDAPGGLVRNTHTTVKPIELMRYLVRLVTVEGGVVLDPFMGSGTTGIAAILEGCKFVGIEREEEYMAIARRRIEHWSAQRDQVGAPA